MAKKTYDISVPVKVLTKHSDIDGLYGPYNTREDAFAALPEAVREAPRTIAIKNAEGKNEEWWWKDGITDGDLVLKESGDFIPLTGTEEGKPVTGAIQFEGDELEFYNEYNATLLRSGTRYGDGELEYVFRYETVPNLGDRDEIVINPFRNEIRGSRYVVPENEYNFVQKKYVDDNIIPIPYDDGNYVVSKESDTLSYVRADQFGQNIANSYQTSIQESGMILGAPYFWETRNQPFYITNLPDKSSDTTFNRLKVQNNLGQEAMVTNAYGILKGTFGQMTAAQSLELGQLLNGGAGSDGAMSVNLISPPIVEKIDSIEYILLRGVNLKLNATSKKIEIIEVSTNTIVYEVPDEHIQLYDDGLSLIFQFNPKDLLVGSYKIKITSGVKVYVTTLLLESVQSIVNVNTDGLTWDVLYNNPSDDLGNNVLQGRNVSVRTPQGISNPSPVIAFKSSEIFAQGDDYYLELKVSATIESDTLQADSELNKSFFGIGYSTSPNALVNNSLVYYAYSFSNSATEGVFSRFAVVEFNNSDKAKVTSINQGSSDTTVVIIKTGNLFRVIIGSTNTSLILSNNSGYSIYGALLSRNKERSFNAQIIKAYKFN